MTVPGFDELPVFLQRDGLLPAPALLAARDQARLTRTTTVFGQEAWLVTAAEDVRTVLGDSSLFTTGDSVPMFRSGDPDILDMPGALLFMDPPERTILRKMLAPRFTGRALARWQPRIVEIIEEHLDALEQAGPPADLMSHFTWQVPSQVICEMLGAPLDERERVQKLLDASFDFTISEAERATANEGINTYIHELALRARANPGAGLLSELVVEHGDELTPKNLAAIGATLLQAGHETTADMMASSVVALLANPDQLAQLRADPTLIDKAVEELLRYLSVVQINPPRRATRDTIVGGQPISSGDLLLVALPAANHDAALVDRPGRLDITRNTTHHLAFGHGIHHCLGAPLARLELTLGLPMLLNRFPELALAVEPSALRFKVGSVVHGLLEVPVTW
ncbi:MULTISPECIES: cytochrome P450 [unclassified Streptomyces]|uniref:cytochrome P450 n=1 Tax=unclassified Streptomyces TaxID=2593676 RepID=UPI00093C1937|nr:cytochrome P450 [Streptomyces sp. CB01883]OKJ74343.1 hypothetical protein AMK32_35690 [Streptomyces sp. CB01883]